MVDIQQTNIRRAVDLLTPSPPNTYMPRMDERALHFTYPVSPEFLTVNPVLLYTAATSINGTLLQMRDDGTGTLAPAFYGDDIEVATEGRFYQVVAITLAGGTVNPIQCLVGIGMVDPGGTFRNFVIHRADVANPGYHFLSSVYVPPGMVLAVQTTAAGGAGDTLTVHALGLKHVIGTPIQMLPAPVAYGV